MIKNIRPTTMHPGPEVIKLFMLNLIGQIEIFFVCVI